MAYSSIPVFPFLLSIIISAFLIPTTFSVADFDLSHSCNDNYTKYSADTYRSNLNNLLQKLDNETPSNNGFLTASSGQAHGLALCRGDVPMKDCQACLDSARGNITEYCPDSRGAIAWRDFCLLKYSNSSFAGNIDTDNRVGLMNVENATDPDFNRTTVDLLSGLSEVAAGQKGMYAEGKVILVEGNKTLQGMVQCSRDLSYGDCATCLKTALADLLSCCVNKIGARIVYGSCQIRYELYTFLK